MTSKDGHGTLTISDVKESDQGAYTCEAINAKGLVFGIPDGVLTLNSNALQGRAGGGAESRRHCSQWLKCLVPRCPVQETVPRVTSAWRVAASRASVLESPRTAKTPDVTATTSASDSQPRMTSKAPKPPKRR